MSQKCAEHISYLIISLIGNGHKKVSRATMQLRRNARIRRLAREIAADAKVIAGIKGLQETKIWIP